jgi:hypothetical protein
MTTDWWRKWFDFVKIILYSNENIEWNCMQFWFELDFLNWIEFKFLNLPIWELSGRSVVGYLSFCRWHGTTMNYMFMLVKLQNQIQISSIRFCNLTSMTLKTKFQFLLFSMSSNFTVGFDFNQWKRTIFSPTQMHSKFPQCIQIAVVKWLNFECKIP